MGGPDRGEAGGRARIPADVEREDRILAGLTARQLAVLAGAAVVLWAAYAATRRLVPLEVFGVGALPVGGLAVALALGRFEGMAADRWLGAAWRHHRSPRRLVPAPGPFPAGLGPGGAEGPVPAPLRLPFGGVAPDGTIDLGADGVALVCRASAVTFSLRAPGEQEALVAGFGRWLNSLAAPVEIVVRAEPIDLAPAIERLVDDAAGLPHPALETAARGHARFLADLAEGYDLLRREVLVVLREPRELDGAGRLHRRAREATASLGGAGVALSVLDGPEASRCLAQALDPAGPARAPGTTWADEPVTLATR